MRVFVSRVGVLLSLCVMAVSALCNARYGMSLAREGFDQYVMMAAAGFADVGKAITWILFASAVGRRQALAAIASFIIFAACLVYAVTGSLGYVAMHRAEAASRLAATGKSAADVDHDLADKRARLKALGVVEPEAAVGKRIEAMKLDRRYTLSAQCNTPAGDLTRSYCAEIAGLEAERENARTADRLEQEIAVLEALRRTADGATAVTKGDYQSALIEHLSGVDVSTVELSLSLLFVVLVESGSCFLLWLSLNHGAANHGEAFGATARSEDRRPHEEHGALAPPSPPSALAGDLVRFVEHCVDLSEDGEVEISALKRAYRRWCERHGWSPLADELVDAGLESFRHAGGLGLKRDGAALGGVVLKPLDAGGPGSPGSVAGALG